MADIADTLQEKAGPFPVWVWGAAIGLVMVAVIWWQGRGDSGSSDVSAVEDAADSTGDVYDAIDGFFRSSAPGSAIGINDTPESVDTNVAWGARAIAHLIGKGTAPLTAQQAIFSYLDGETLTATQAELVNEAIKGIGQPPDPVDKPKTDSGTTYTRYYRDRKGQVYGVTADGTETAISDEKYISLGLPKLSPDAAAYKYHKVANHTTTLDSIAKRYNTTSNHLIALNGWKTGVRIAKGKKVKVPA